MRKFGLVLLLMFLATTVRAEVYLLYHKQTKEILSMSDLDDAVMPEEYKKEILPGELRDYPLQYHPQYYKYQGNRFVLNIEKLSDDALAEEKMQNENTEMRLILKKQRYLACQALEADGQVFEFINCENFK